MSTTETAPWQDEATLRRLYLEEDLERAAVAARLGCSKSAIDDWLNRYGITKSRDTPWRDADTLRELHHDQGLSATAVAEELDCTFDTVVEWMDRLAIERRIDGRTETYTDAELLAALRRVHEDCEHRITQAALHAADGPSPTTCVRRFGSWATALHKAGIDPVAPTRAPTPPRQTLDSEQGSLLLARQTAAWKVCRADAPFRRDDVDLTQSAFAKFRMAGIIQHAGRVSETGTSPWLWEPADGVVEWIEARLDPAGECPRPGCHATGIHNIPGGEGDEGYACTNPECTETFDEATALEVIGG